MNHTLAQHFLRSITTLAIAFGLATYSNAVSAQCSKDTDCKADRLCVKGVCVDPPGRTTGTSSAISEKPTQLNGGSPTDRAPVPAPARTPHGNRETANPGGLEQLSASIDRGETVVFAVRTGVDEVHKWGEVGSHEVVVSKTAVTFRAKGGQDIFMVSPEKILAVDREPKLWRLRMKVAVTHKGGGKEEKTKVDLFHPAVWSWNGETCNDCDTSMDVLYALLQKVRGQDYEASLAKSQAAARKAELTKQLDKERYEAEAARLEAETARLGAECPGIELMGLYNVDMRPMSPLIVYQAKARNAASVTRIVTISWLDNYGAEKETSGQIRPGDIGTFNLGPQEPQDRQPINLRVKSCQ